ncbi:hypothetical protein GCM10020221_28920 [Streptomyces thioluteus]|uniref:Lantibiotic n=1 Tax=Streptomyces thioluteus TaxID=66431 RepID=A0ABN3X0X8_STRTU|nr:hypothetical protein [Streptomyces caatingaensis]
MPHVNLDGLSESLDITDLDLDVNVPETDFTSTKYVGSTSTCNSWNGHVSRCWNCN